MKKKRSKLSDKYLKIVRWSEEDGCYVGTFPGLMLGGIHGDDETRVYIELCQTVEEVLKLYKKDQRPLPQPTSGKNFSGKFVLRVGKDLHQIVALKALQEGESLNSYCTKIIKSNVT
jgi:predicted HicB family RNase H-like nuclease